MSNKYIKPFDGLRVIAFLGVFFYHLVSGYCPSGYFGVVIFFVMAGYLSVQSFMEREEPSSINQGLGKIAYKIRKLYPALLITVAVVTIIMIMGFRKFLSSYPVEAISSILSVNNYAQIIKNESYFEAMNSIKPLTHLWALSLEFQFYVILYLVMFPFYKKSNKNKWLIGMVIAFIISMICCIILCIQDSGVSTETGVNAAVGYKNLTRYYYGIDTRLSTFLLGMIAAFLANNFKDFTSKNRKALHIVDIILTIALIAAMFISMTTTVENVIGITIYAAVLSLLMIFIANEHNLCVDELEQSQNKEKPKQNLLNTLLSAKIMTVLVKRSYVFYLVHYPIIIFMNRYFAHSMLNYYLKYLVIILITIVATEVLYRIVDLVFDKNWKKKLSPIILIVLAVFIVAASAYAKFGGIAEQAYVVGQEEAETAIYETYADETIEEETTVTAETVEKVVKNDKGDTENVESYKSDNVDMNDYKIRDTLRRIDDVNAVIGGKAKLSHDEFLNFRNWKITIIGDSVTECAQGSLKLYFPFSFINPGANRQLSQAVGLYEDMKTKGEIGDAVVVALGTNSNHDIEVEALQKIYDDIDGKVPMVILTVAIPAPAEEMKRNRALIGFANSHDNCFLADWYSCMKSHTELFLGDDTHPTKMGNDVYAQLIYKTLVDALEWRKQGKEWCYYGNTKQKQFSYTFDVNVGETVKFGKYFINNDTDKEDIEWIAINKDEKNKRIMLLSKYAIDCKQYQKHFDIVTWQRCDLRQWLNHTFFDTAFEIGGSRFIVASKIENKKNPQFSTVEAGTSTDYVFVPSYEETRDFITGDLLKCKGTKYFTMNNGWSDTEPGSEGNCDWWLRTPGDFDNHVMNVDSKGEIIMIGDYVNTDDFGVRPCIWVQYE